MSAFGNRDYVHFENGEGVDRTSSPGQIPRQGHKKMELYTGPYYRSCSLFSILAVDDITGYTEDWAVIKVYSDKFKGNVIDLGN